jgi:hypothetical protein
MGTAQLSFEGVVLPEVIACACVTGSDITFFSFLFLFLFFEISFIISDVFFHTTFSTSNTTFCTVVVASMGFPKSLVTH